ncbi:tyrosine-type recombinase/integrase [Haloarchaeobius sp. HME9146]|uniref:tyrosine-type recombinase/integrase n=1 Tax=Haloarchaeobius sp. HME9146 TaxID=2978732 RepID=UPI0021BF65FB|nr:tyrosine-type recombinase/integrase [Haloarchaeobius sp. HME9146]MCT9096510.1 tyrosine-type recombinase/integrase [Haloarchaeobius sp. HME9146]
MPEMADSVAYFLEDQTYHGKAKRTQEAYERVLRRFEAFLADPESGPSGGSMTPADADRRQCMAWVHSLRGEHAPSTVASYASYVHRFYAYMTQVGEFESNPMALVVEEMNESIDKDPTRRELTVDQMRGFVADIGHPLERALVVSLLKTGMRVGELCNLDLRDISLAVPAIESEYDLGGRVQLEGRPDSIFVPAEPAHGEEYHGEERTAANKRKRSTVVPVDDELKRVLVAWLAIRPDAVSPAEPLFCSTSSDWGERITPQGVRHIVETHAREHGWYRTGGGAAENVTPHYFRHFFTTHLRDRTGDRGIVKYLRGDVASDIIDTYTHNWGDRVRKVYEANVYSLL